MFKYHTICVNLPQVREWRAFKAIQCVVILKCSKVREFIFFIKKPVLFFAGRTAYKVESD